MLRSTNLKPGDLVIRTKPFRTKPRHVGMPVGMLVEPSAEVVGETPYFWKVLVGENIEDWDSSNFQEVLRG